MGTEKGSLVIYDDILKQHTNEAVESLEIHFESHNETDDEVQKLVTTISNKCNIIDALLESLKYNFFQLSEKHFDNNGKDIAESLKRKFEKVYENYYWRVHEVDTSKLLHPEWCNSYLGLLFNLTNEGHQCLVVPKMRKDYFDMVKGDSWNPLTDKEAENEFQEYLAYVRQVFNLSEDFR